MAEPVSATAVESLLVKGALASLTCDKDGAHDLALFEALNALGYSKKARRPSPLALRLCASRWRAMRRCVDALVRAMPAKPWVVLNGAYLSSAFIEEHWCAGQRWRRLRRPYDWAVAIESCCWRCRS